MAEEVIVVVMAEVTVAAAADIVVAVEVDMETIHVPPVTGIKSY
jgi:hypothetical protein